MAVINVFITQLSGERLWGIDSPLPAQVQMAINVNFLGFERKSAKTAESPFVFTVSFTPSVAQISIKGRAQTLGDESELDKLVEDFKNQKPPPAVVVQAVSSATLAEAIVIAKAIGVPPLFPPFLFPKNSPNQDLTPDILPRIQFFEEIPTIQKIGPTMISAELPQLRSKENSCTSGAVE